MQTRLCHDVQYVQKKLMLIYALTVIKKFATLVKPLTVIFSNERFHESTTK